MINPSVSLLLTACAIALPSAASINPRVPTARSTVLKPIGIRDYEAATGLQRRANSVDLSDLDKRTQAQLIYGTPGENGQLVLANMTVYAEDGLELVMMERFEGLTSSVDCKGDDGTMSLTFSSQDAFDYALKQWDFINDSDDGSFLLIANHHGCGPDGERQPYLISKITEDATSRTTFLAAKPASWEEVLTGTFDIDFGHVTPFERTAKIKERGLFGDIANDIGDVAESIGDTLQGNFDETGNANFDVSVGTKGQRSNIYSDSNEDLLSLQAHQDSRFTLDCVNCFTSGSFAVTGRISTHHWSLKTLTLSAHPQDFQAQLELEAKISATASLASLNYEKELLSLPVPGAGISIPKIFNLGATVAYDVGIGTIFQGTATVDFGLSAALPNTAQLTVDLASPGDSSATGFGEGSVTPLFDVKELSASVTLAAYSKPKIQFGLEIIKIGTAAVDIGVKLPEIDATLTTTYNAAGVCTGNPSTTGVKLDSNIGIEVDLDLTAKLGGFGLPSYSKPLFKETRPLASQCFPLKIPGLAPQSTALPIPATALISTQLPPVPPTEVPSASGVTAILVPVSNSIVIVPYSVIPLSSVGVSSATSSFNGTGYTLGPSGTLPSSTGGLPLSSAIPPYPYSSGSFGSAAPTAPSYGTASSAHPPYPYSPGVLASAAPTGTNYDTSFPALPYASSFSTSKGSAPVVTASPTIATKLPTSAVSSSTSASGTLGLSRRKNFGFKSPPIPRAAAISDGCRMVERLGKRVLLC